MVLSHGVVTETSFSTYILLCSLLEPWIMAMWMTEYMSNHILGLAGIREKLEREKKEFKFLLFYFPSSKISSREVWNGYKYQFSVPEWSQHVMSETVLAWGRHSSWILLFRKKESSLSWLKPPSLKAWLLKFLGKRCECVCTNEEENENGKCPQFIMLTLTGLSPSSLMF